jgi:predicted permease
LSPEREAEIVEELSQHLDERYEELRLAGAKDREAFLRALDELLEPDSLARGMRSLRQARVPPPVTLGAGKRSLLGDFLQDFRYAGRLLGKQRGFAAAAILTIALGIGANTAIFTLVNAALFVRLPVPDRDNLLYVNRAESVFSYPLYEALRDGNRVFDGFAAWGGIEASLNAGGAAELVQGVIVTGNFFDVLGIRAAQGRLLSTSDDRTPGGHPVLAISHELWRTGFGARPDIVGLDVRLNGHVFTVLGVTPAGFPGPRFGMASHLYVPMMMQPIVRPPRGAYSGEQNPDLLHDTRSWLSGLARLKPGVTHGQARAELETIATRYRRTADPAAPVERIALVPVDVGDPGLRRRMQGAALLLGGVAAAVLMIACSNIANLLLAKAASRQRELALRLALGAARARLVRQLLTESLLLSAIGGSVGVAIAWAAVESFQAASSGMLPLSLDFSVDRRVLLFSAGLSLLTGILFGIVPAIRTSGPALMPALKNATTESDGRNRGFHLQKMLVTAEVALSMLLLIPAALFVRSLQAAQSIDPGFDVEKLVSAPLNINLLRYTSERGRVFYRQVVERIERMPGVDSATVARIPVMGGSGRVLGIMVEGRREYSADSVFGEGGGVTTTDQSRINANVVGPRFFATLGIPIVMGRDFGEPDVEGRPPVVTLNESAVRVHFGSESPIGRRVSFGGPGGPWREVVGVVRDSTYSALGEAALPVAYLPVAQNHETGMTLYVRASVPPGSLVSSIRSEIRALEPDLPMPAVRTMTESLDRALFGARMGAWLLGVFGALALMLAAIGIYGVLSFSISRRTHEMGVRLALGAPQRQVFSMVVRDGMALVAAGIVIGVAGGLAVARSLGSFLYGVPATDTTTFAAMTLVLAAVAFAACIIPARRATRVNPISALRSE